MRVRSDEFSRIFTVNPDFFGDLKSLRNISLPKMLRKNTRIQSDVYYYRETIHIEYISITYNYESVKMLNDLNSIGNLEIPKWRMMKLESSSMFEEFMRFVREMAKGQIEKAANLKMNKMGKLRKWAEKLISDGGYWSAQAVSKRILDFAKSISDGDRSKIPLLREAIEKAFNEVKKKFGGELPEVSEKTYELVMDGFEEWEEKGS